MVGARLLSDPVLAALAVSEIVEDQPAYLSGFCHEWLACA